MSKKTEALKLALEALSASDDFLFNYHDCEPNNECEVDAYSEVRGNNMKAWEAIREALAEQPAPPPECQTEAEKTAFAFGWWKALEQKRKDEQPAQKQKPVPSIIQMLGHCPECGAKAHHFTSPPASKPWVGLTDEQRDAIEQRIYCQTIQKGKTRGEYVNKMMCAIEAKLREKNA